MVVLSFNNLFIFFIVAIIFICYIKFSSTDLVYVKGNDEEFHLVRNMDDKNIAANLMAEIKNRCEELIKYLIKTYPHDKKIELLKSRYNENNIEETDLSENSTSYSLNKGKEISLCLRNKETQRLEQINILMFVTLHELAHLMTKEYTGHDAIFTNNFIFLLKNASAIGIYNPVNYAQVPQEYCGITVDSSPIF